MKITEESINHNVVRLIKDLSLSDFGVAETSLEECKYWFGYIDGLIQLGESLKGVERG